MKIIVDFEKRKAGAPANESWDIPNELMPLISAYAWKPKKGDAVMDFIAELSECETECEFTCDDANVKCMAVVGKGRGIVLIANLAKSSVPLRMECRGMKVKTVRLIDNNRTDVRIPMLAALPPLSILQIKCSAGKE